MSYLSEFVRLFPDVPVDLAALGLGPLDDGVEIFDRERDVLDAVAVLHQVDAHHLGLFRVGLVTKRLTLLL